MTRNELELLRPFSNWLSVSLKIQLVECLLETKKKIVIRRAIETYCLAPDRT